MQSASAAPVELKRVGSHRPMIVVKRKEPWDMAIARRREQIHLYPHSEMLGDPKKKPPVKLPVDVRTRHSRQLVRFRVEDPREMS